MINFKSDDTINKKGFSAAFVLSSPDAPPGSPLLGSLSPLGGGGNPEHQRPSHKNALKKQRDRATARS